MKSRIPDINSAPATARKRLFPGWLFLLALLGLCAAPVKADEPQLAWACWLGDLEPVNIICIHDRAQAQQAVPDEMEATILDHIYERILSDQTSGLEEFAQRYNKALRGGEIWFIPIWINPYKESWDEKFPQRLVAATLCRKKSPCRIILRKPAMDVPEANGGTGRSEKPAEGLHNSKRRRIIQNRD